MCGIAGVVGRHDKSGLSRMLGAIRHRGPDDSGEFHDEAVSLGMNRLAVLDLSKNAHQPMVSQNGRFVIVYNGEVFNYNEHKSELTGVVPNLRSHSDTEVVLELFSALGTQSFSKLRGMFAMGIWDKLTGTLYLVRDQFGIKPLYYTIRQDTLIFASELRAFAALDRSSTLVSHDSVHQLLSLGYVVPPHTIYKDIFLLEPGHYLQWNGSKSSIVKYWDLDPRPDIPVSELDAIASVKSLVEKSVNEQLVSDVPLGVFLSGGLDSSVMVAALRNQGVQRISTFSVGFDGAGESLDESEDALVTAKHFNTDHHHLRISGHDVLNKFSHFISGVDQPTFDGLNTYLVSDYAKRNVTVALSGLGSDEIFSGYSIDRKIVNGLQSSPLHSVLSISKGIWKQFPSIISTRLQGLYTRSSLVSHYTSWGEINSEHQVNVLHPNSRAEQEALHRIAYWDTSAYGQKLQRVARLHLKTFMAGRLLRDTDALSMIHSLEVRVPFLDVRLWEYLFYLPQNLKLSSYKVKRYKQYEGDVSYQEAKVKSLLYQAFEKELPENFLARSKRGFKIPLDKWLRGELHEILNDVLSSSSTLLEKKELRSLLAGFNAGTVNWSRMWLVLVLEAWYAGKN